jgi:hypothetical protein
MDGRQGGCGIPRPSRRARPAGQTALSNWTTRPVQLDWTDTPDLGTGDGSGDAAFRRRPVGPSRGPTHHCLPSTGARMSVVRGVVPSSANTAWIALV